MLLSGELNDISTADNDICIFVPLYSCLPITHLRISQVLLNCSRNS